MKQLWMTACAALLLAMPGAAMADDPPAPGEGKSDRARAMASAKEHNHAAMRLFNLGKFEQAVEAYQKAYKAYPLPEFLYNLGQCHERMQGVENLERAKFFFEGYLTNKPEALNRREVEELVKEIERKLDTLRSVRRPVVLMPSELTAQGQEGPTPWYKSWWFWTIVSVAVAGGAAAAVVLNLPEEPTPVEGSLFPGTIELRLGW